ncbi:hypothetical protein DRW42_02370 [Pedobacter miscanthi]|uniref:Uncharacterized protein n=1 Tax=Pedobacter miscanthi TaxID=2259170 RepID=A0A366LC24_9SPHI|nr:hypothetical protein DRW42_02370 [Pedobacter miscanthi]
MVNKLYKYKLLILIVIYFHFMKPLIYDFKLIKVFFFGFMVWLNFYTFVKLLYYFKHEYFSFTKAL